jgi:hypothetical protein
MAPKSPSHLPATGIGPVMSASVYKSNPPGRKTGYPDKRIPVG